MRALYIETLIRADLSEVWRRTQDPSEHQRWDLRFTRIEYQPEIDAAPRRFRYATAVLPGLTIEGVGIFAGERWRPDGTCTSALRFRGTHPFAIVGEGHGYWRYVPVNGGIRFRTGYDYQPAWGRFGAVADHLVRPLMGWATAWSFDRLRLWLERGITPRRSLVHAGCEVAVRATSCVLVAALAPPGLIAAAIAVAVLTPPLPGTPAARRCRRRPDRNATHQPMNTLERP